MCDALDEFVFIGNGCSYLVYWWWRLPFCGTPGKKTVRTITGDDGFERCSAHVTQWKASVFARKTMWSRILKVSANNSPETHVSKLNRWPTMFFSCRLTPKPSQWRIDWVGTTLKFRCLLYLACHGLLTRTSLIHAVYSLGVNIRMFTEGMWCVSIGTYRYCA